MDYVLDELITNFIMATDILMELTMSCSWGFLGVLLRYRLVNSMLQLPNPPEATEDMIADLFSRQSFLLPNIVGCFVMGFLVSWGKTFPSFAGRKFYRDMHIGLATGFCGCLTTYSTWLATFNSRLFNRYWFLDILCLVVEFCVTWSFFNFGEYLCDVLLLLSNTQRSESEIISDPPKVVEMISDSCRHQDGIDQSSFVRISNEETGDIIANENLKIEIRSIETIINTASPEITERSSTELLFGTVAGILVIFATIILWAICLVDVNQSLFVSEYSRNATRSVAFAPFGVSLRYFLKKWEVQSYGAVERNVFPWSTFLCNICGSSVAAGLFFYVEDWSWNVGFSTGFLGSWTTVSSLMREMEDLQYRRGKWGPIYSFIYVFVTFSVTIMLINIIRVG